MERCLFIGGPIDGQWRECESERTLIPVPTWLGGSTFDHATSMKDETTATYSRGSIADAFGKRHTVYYHGSLMTPERCVVHELLDGYVSAADRELLRRAKLADERSNWAQK